MAGLYLSRGNVPSTWTHALQGVRMAEALADSLPGFALVTQTHPSLLQQPRFDFEHWYGIRRPFRIIRLPSPDPELTAEPLIEGWSHPLFDRAAVDYALKIKADFVLTRSARTAYMAVRKGIPTVVEIHVGPLSRHFKRLLPIRHDPNLRGVVTVSDLAAKGYVRSGMPAEKIFVWPDAVDLEAFSIDRPPKDIRQELDLPKDRHIATYCGHLYQGRGLEDILIAAESLPDTLFLMVGGTPDKLREWSVRAAHLDNLRFEGHVPHHQVPLYLAASDLLLLPYSAACTTAPWMSPMKLFESMAAARPIIASDLPALRPTLRPNDNAFLIPPDHADALTDAIKSAIRQPHQAQRLAKQARRDVEGLSWDRRAKAIIDYFDLHHLSSSTRALENGRADDRARSATLGS